MSLSGQTFPESNELSGVGFLYNTGMVNHGEEVFIMSLTYAHYTFIQFQEEFPKQSLDIDGVKNIS